MNNKNHNRFLPKEHEELMKKMSECKTFIIPVQISIDKCRYDELIAKEEKLRLLEGAIKTLNSTYASEIRMLQEII